MLSQISILFLILVLSNGEPVFVMDIVRHGIHTAGSNMSEIPDITWTMYDELTPSGNRQQYLLGRLRRYQYIEKNHLLTEKFDPKSVYVRASNFRRNYMSAQAYLLGLYPYGLENFNENQRKIEEQLIVPRIPLNVSKELIHILNGQVIPRNIPIFPIVSLDKSIEETLRVYRCPMYEYTIGNYFRSDKYKNLFKKYNELWIKITNIYPKLDENFLSKDDKAIKVTDFFLSAEGAGKRPLKFTDDMIKGLKEFWSKALEEQLTVNHILLNITVNKWTEDITHYMDDVIAGNTILKYVLHSTHSRGTLAMLLALQRFNNSIINTGDDFTANVLFELNKEDGNKYNVKVYYNGDEIISEEYNSFKTKLLKVGELKSGRYSACVAPSNYVKEEFPEIWD